MHDQTLRLRCKSLTRYKIELIGDAMHTADREASIFLIVCNKVLDDRSDRVLVVFLQPLDITRSDLAIQQRILGERLESPATEG